MKAILKYNLPEEQEEFETANNGWKYRSVLLEYDNHLRSKIKYDESLTEEQYKVYEDARNKLWEFLNEDNLKLF
jgi:hypothetical protein